MGTSLKNTRRANTFAGLLSWGCLLLVFCAVASAVIFFLMVLSRPEMLDYATGHLQEFAGSQPPALPGMDREAVSSEAVHHEELVYAYTVKIISALAILLAATIMIFAFRRDRHAFEDLVAKALGRIWVEAKLAILFCVATSAFRLISWSGTERLFFIGIMSVLLIYLLCLDIGHNRRFFSHNIIHSILVRLNDYKTMTTFQQRALRRAYTTIAMVVFLALFGLVGFLIVSELLRQFPSVALFVVSLAVTGIVGTIWWYILSLKRDLRDWNVLMDQITEMYGGDLNATNHVPPTSNLYDCAMQLNMIRTGVRKAVEEGTKADRTKIELITNVSHDIKTPLTSIISYVELLKKESGLPPQAADYVNTISQKAQRLSSIVQDVFDVSKAATGNISLNMENLDVGRLLRQTFAEMEETIQHSKLQWRMDIPDAQMLIHADGQRLYRVFQNLIRNCTQYSLEGSRVYVTVTAQNGLAQVSVRNISKNEIHMDGEELTARFVRGDQNRTTEGSGLGLSIAKSFTEACGGRFFVRTDGDLFIVTVQFQLVEVSIPEATVNPPSAKEPEPVPHTEPQVPKLEL